MDEKDKKILDLAAKFLIQRGCEFGEFDVDYYTNKPYRGGRYYRCGNNYGFVTMPFDMTNTIETIVEENGDKIYEEMEFDDGYGSISQITVRIYPNERKIKGYGIYQVLATGEEETGQVEIPDDILKRFVENGVTNGRVEFNGGGDSGYVEDTIYMDGENKSMNTIDDANNSINRFLERCLDDYGDWYNNEGASGSLYIDTEDKYVTWSVFPNEYKDVEEFFFEVDF